MRNRAVLFIPIFKQLIQKKANVLKVNLVDERERDTLRSIRD